MSRARRGSFAALLLVTAGFSAAPVAQVPTTVSWTNGRLSVQTTDAPLTELMMKVSTVTGLTMTGVEKLTGRVSVEFTDLPPKEALARLLSGVNYVLQESPPVTPDASPLLVLRVHSMAPQGPSDLAHQPLHVSMLDGLVASDALQASEEAMEAEDDADVADERADSKTLAAQLVNEGAFGPKASAESLLEYLEDVNSDVRAEAVKALGSRPPGGSFGRLTEALGDDSYAVREAAVLALGQMRDAESLQRIGMVLRGHGDLGVRVGALRVLAQRADPAAIVHLRAVASDADTNIRDIARQMIEEFEQRARLKRESKRPAP